MTAMAQGAAWAIDRRMVPDLAQREASRVWL